MRPDRALRLVAVVVLVGLAAGVSGIAVTLVIDALEFLAFGDWNGSLLSAVQETPPWRRFAAITAAGVVGGLGWWALRRWGRPVVPVTKAVAGERMPLGTTIANVGLQIGIVGLGASIGREAAPRELAAVLSDRITAVFGLGARERRILIACGAGAGLAAVYDVPLGGALFALEVLLGELTLATAIPALATAAIGTWLAQLVVSPAPVYVLPAFDAGIEACVWALPIGVVAGAAGTGFAVLARRAERIRPTGTRLIWVMPLVFAAVGAVAMLLPDVIGNGVIDAQTVFAGGAGAGLVAILVLGKAATTTATIGAGAAGGTLTPSFAMGATLGALLGFAAAAAWPGTPLAACAVLGGAAFLAAELRAPFTAALLAIEFTGVGPGMFIPVMLAVAASVSLRHLVDPPRLGAVD